MSLPRDLLEQARHLATHDRGKPKQASIRRAISTAYYALFHLLTSEAASRFVTGSGRKEMRDMLRRTYTHTGMAAACIDIVKPTPPKKYQTPFWTGWSPRLKNVARAFSDLQEARHKADYDLSSVINRAEAIDAVSRASKAFDDWEAVRGTPHADGFLLILLIHRKTSPLD